MMTFMTETVPRPLVHLYCLAVASILILGTFLNAESLKLATPKQFEHFCVDCHDNETQRGNLNLVEILNNKTADRSVIFENLITGKMPPRKKKQPSDEQKQIMLGWLASHQDQRASKTFRRISRHEFVHSVNDLLGVQLDLADDIPEDRNTHDFDSNQNILLTRQQLSAYFTTADKALDFALPTDGFLPEKTWVTNVVKESHPTYNKYIRKHNDGILFSWTRANNGNSYSFFYDKFDPPVAGWYELTFDAAKLGEFKEDVSVLVFAGKYFFADDRPQPQRLLDVISLGDKELKPYSVKAFLKPGENVSVHCYSKHTWRQSKGEQGAYIKQLTIKGPVFKQWPPRSYKTLFAGLTLNDLSTARRRRVVVAGVDAKDLKRVIRSFAQRAFSSELTDEALAPYHQIALDHLRKHGDFVMAARAGFKAIISSHRFLLAPGFHSNGYYAQSAALARALWLSVPDQAAFNIAAKNRLTGTVLKAEINRMLRDPRSRRMINSFCGQWLNLRSFDQVAPSLKLYPSYDDLLHHYLPIETEAYVAHLIEHNLPIRALIDSDFSILNQRLAQHYGLEDVKGQKMRKVTFNPDSPRGGLMTMGSVLKVTTDGVHTSPILRGAWISKNIAGIAMSPPPESVEVLEPNLAVAKTLKEQIAEHKKSKTCYTCHKSIDPYGFALENFDATGQWRTRYRIETRHNGTFQYRPQGYYKVTGPVDASGDVNGKTFTDIVGLKQLMLSDHKRVAYNFAKKFYEYVKGSKPNLTQRLDLYNIIPDKPEACRIRDLISDVLVYATEGVRP